MLCLDAKGKLHHRSRSQFASLLRRDDLIVANDAATIPASLSGYHGSTGSPVEVRLAGRRSLRVEDVTQFSAVVFGAGDFRTRTEDRPAPPVLRSGDRLHLGPLQASVTGVLNHPRFIGLAFDGGPAQIWEGLARHGRPIQYAHGPDPLSIWDVWTPIAGAPVAFEPPSAGFFLDWGTVAASLARGARFATLTHAAGISSTGDAMLDALLPLDEAYFIPETTAEAIATTKKRGGRVVAIGTTVVRALEHAANDEDGRVPAGEGLATLRIGPHTRLSVVDAIVSGTHEPGTSHYELLRSFVDDFKLSRLDRELQTEGYRTHEFGDSVFLERIAVPNYLARMAKPNIESPAATTTY
jgi:S-adenosylmethionine:tRNA ribosyltransferase-isomerase